MLFLKQINEILCAMVGLRRLTQDLPQGGLELPCTLTFSGDSSAVSKVETLLVARKVHSRPKEAVRLFAQINF